MKLQKRNIAKLVESLMSTLNNSVKKLREALTSKGLAAGGN